MKLIHKIGHVDVTFHFSELNETDYVGIWYEDGWVWKMIYHMWLMMSVQLLSNFTVSHETLYSLSVLKPIVLNKTLWLFTKYLKIFTDDYQGIHKKDITAILKVDIHILMLCQVYVCQNYGAISCILRIHIQNLKTSKPITGKNCHINIMCSIKNIWHLPKQACIDYNNLQSETLWFR